MKRKMKIGNKLKKVEMRRNKDVINVERVDGCVEKMRNEGNERKEEKKLEKEKLEEIIELEMKGIEVMEKKGKIEKEDIGKEIGIRKDMIKDERKLREESIGKKEESEEIVEELMKGEEGGKEEIEGIIENGRRKMIKIVLNGVIGLKKIIEKKKKRKRIGKEVICMRENEEIEIRRKEKNLMKIGMREEE